MNMELYKRSFVGTQIKTPFDQMRANAMINAQHDERGLSILHFNINAFMRDGRYEDLFYILKLWAVEPMKRQPQKFQRYPLAGYKALMGRIKILETSLAKRANMSQWFIETSAAQMREITDQYIHDLCPDLQEKQSRQA